MIIGSWCSVAVRPDSGLCPVVVSPVYLYLILVCRCAGQTGLLCRGVLLAYLFFCIGLGSVIILSRTWAFHFSIVWWLLVAVIVIIVST